MPHNTSARRQLAIAAAVAEKIKADPDTLLALGRRNLARMRSMPSAERSGPWLDEWDDRIAAGPERVISVLLDPGEHGHDMRQMTPFAGALTNHERWAVLREVYGEVA